MAFTSDIELKIPFNELTFIKPEQRIKFFKQLINDYKQFVPSLNLIYAYLHWGDDSNKKKKVTINRNTGSMDSEIKVERTNESSVIIDNKALDPNYLNNINDYISKNRKPDEEEYNVLSYKDSEFASKNDGDVVEVPVFDQPCMIDYILIFTVIINGVETVFIEAPYIYSKRSLPGYRFCMREDKQVEFFKLAIDEMTRTPRKLFDEFIREMCKLSTDETSDKYWKKEENYDDLVQMLVSLNLRFHKNLKHM